MSSGIRVQASWSRFPSTRANSIKLAASRGLSLRTCTDFDTVGVFWQHAWLSAPN